MGRGIQGISDPTFTNLHIESSVAAYRAALLLARIPLEDVCLRILSLKQKDKVYDI